MFKQGSSVLGLGFSHSRIPTSRVPGLKKVSQSRGPRFKTTGWIRSQLSLSYFRSRSNEYKLRSATSLKKRLWHGCFPVNFVKFLRTPFLQNTSGGCFCYYFSTKKVLFDDFVFILTIGHTFCGDLNWILLFHDSHAQINSFWFCNYRCNRNVCSADKKKSSVL